MTESKPMMARTHKGGAGGVAIATSRNSTAEDEAQHALQIVRMALFQCESV